MRCGAVRADPRPLHQPPLPGPGHVSISHPRQLSSIASSSSPAGGVKIQGVQSLKQRCCNNRFVLPHIDLNEQVTCGHNCRIQFCMHCSLTPARTSPAFPGLAAMFGRTGEMFIGVAGPGGRRPVQYVVDIGHSGWVVSFSQEFRFSDISPER